MYVCVCVHMFVCQRRESRRETVREKENGELDTMVHIRRYFQQATTFISVGHQDHSDCVINYDIREGQ